MKKKIIAVISTLKKGGVERTLSVLSQEWIKENEVKIIVFDGSNIGYSFSGKVINLKLPALKGTFPKIIQFFRRFIQLKKLFKKEDPDHIISFMESANFASIFAAYFTNKTKNLMISVRTNPKTMLRSHRLLIPYLYAFSKKIITVSKGVSNALIKMGVPSKKIKIIYNPLPLSIPTISNSLSRPKDAPNNYILGVGRLVKLKGFDLLIDAFSKIPNQNIHLVILGEGKERKKLESIILNKDLKDRTHLIGSVDDLWQWYRHAKCFVSSSLTESWGNVIVEAMSQNCPVVAFDCDYGPREIIKDKVNGLLVEINNVQSLTNILSSLLSDHQLSNKLRYNGLIRSSEFDAKMLSLEWLKDD